MNLFPWGLNVTPKPGVGHGENLLCLALLPPVIPRVFHLTAPPCQSQRLQESHFLHELKDDTGTNPLLFQITKNTDQRTLLVEHQVHLIFLRRERGQQEMVILVISRPGRKDSQAPFYLQAKHRAEKNCLFSSVTTATRVFLFCF